MAGWQALMLFPASVFEVCWPSLWSKKDQIPLILPSLHLLLPLTHNRRIPQKLYVCLMISCKKRASSLWVKPHGKCQSSLCQLGCYTTFTPPSFTSWLTAGSFFRLFLHRTSTQVLMNSVGAEARGSLKESVVGGMLLETDPGVDLPTQFVFD